MLVGLNPFAVFAEVGITMKGEGGGGALILDRV